MKRKFSCVLYVFCTVVIVLIFTIFGLFLYKNNSDDFPACIANFSLTNGEITVECGGFASGNAVFTVAHLFSYYDRNECIYDNNGICAFVHMSNNLVCSVDGENTAVSFIYADFNTDAAVVFLTTSVYPDVINREPVVPDRYLAPVGSGEKYRLVSGTGTALIDGKRFLALDYTADKGLSGYPVFDSSGYVNAIICSFDKNNGRTYAVPSDALLSTMNDAENLFGNICSRHIEVSSVFQSAAK